MPLRVLFFAQGVSLAHVARPSLLADAIAATGAEIHFASNGQYSMCHTGRSWQFHAIDCMSPQAFLDRLAAGSPLCREDELEQQIGQDLQLIARVQPDVVVGDFRLSLNVSARLAGVRLLSVCNAYWSPYARDLRPPPAPDLPIRRLLGRHLFDPIFSAVWPLASRVHVSGMNTVRRRHGLARYATLREMYCDGDQVMYADTPQLSPVDGAPPSHSYLGPIVWSPEVVKPTWWAMAREGRGSLAYVTLGSTGIAERLPDVVKACRDAGWRCLVATAGRVKLAPDPPDVYVTDFLPGSEAAALADIVVCNGGSPTTHQALAHGRPVLGICANIDQMLNMRQIALAGAGVYLRTSEASADTLANCLAQASQPQVAQAARRLAAEFSLFDAQSRFSDLALLA